MGRRELKDKYFEWMYNLVCSPEYCGRRSYKKLFSKLHEIQFTYIIGMDCNRAEDGEDLRYRFAYEFDLEGPEVTTYLDDRPCSVLEMLIALSLRCEEHILSNPAVGNRTGELFWTMIKNLGLYDMIDSKYDSDYISNVVDRFLNREPSPIAVMI